jgi:hypothetical protein
MRNSLNGLQFKELGHLRATGQNQIGFSIFSKLLCVKGSLVKKMASLKNSAPLKSGLKIASIMVAGRISKQRINLYRFAQMAGGCGLEVFYEPELLNYAKVDIKDHTGRRIGSVCIFTSGKANFMGFKSIADVNAAFDQLKAALKTMNEREDALVALLDRSDVELLAYTEVAERLADAPEWNTFQETERRYIFETWAWEREREHQRWKQEEPRKRAKIAE